MPHPTLTLQLRSVEHVCNVQGTLTCPASRYPFKYVQKAKKTLPATAVQQSVSNYMSIIEYPMI